MSENNELGCHVDLIFSETEISWMCIKLPFPARLLLCFQDQSSSLSECVFLFSCEMSCQADLWSCAVIMAAGINVISVAACSRQIPSLTSLAWSGHLATFCVQCTRQRTIPCTISICTAHCLSKPARGQHTRLMSSNSANTTTLI